MNAMGDEILGIWIAEMQHVVHGELIVVNRDERAEIGVVGYVSHVLARCKLRGKGSVVMLNILHAVGAYSEFSILLTLILSFRNWETGY